MMNNEDLEGLVKDVEEKEKNLIQTPSTDKAIKSGKSESKNEKSNGTKQPLVDFELINSKETPLDNSEILLSLFEVATNPHAYNITSSNNSRTFWDKLPELNQFKKILEVYKTETLRKYWRVLSEISTSPNKVIDVIKRSKDSINLSSLKLLTIISNIKESISGKLKNLDETLLACSEKKLANKLAKKPKKEDESINEAPKKLLNKKRRNESEILQSLTNKIDIVNSHNHKSEEEETNNNGKRSTRAKTTSGLFSDEDISYFSQIEIIVQTFKSLVPEATITEIWDCLKRNSFNIISSYLYLINPDSYEGKNCTNM